MTKKYAEVVKAVEPILEMLDAGGARYSSATIFEDGSGRLSVPSDKREEAERLLAAHGVVGLSGSPSQSRHRYDYYIDLPSLLKFTTTLCPHCGKDTLVEPPKLELHGC